MKKIKASELKAGDVFIDVDMYSTVLMDAGTFPYSHYLKVKCIIAPTDTFIKPGSMYLISINQEVLLLCRDGKEVLDNDIRD